MIFELSGSMDVAPIGRSRPIVVFCKSVWVFSWRRVGRLEVRIIVEKDGGVVQTYFERKNLVALKAAHI